MKVHKSIKTSISEKEWQLKAAIGHIECVKITSSYLSASLLSHSSNIQHPSTTHILHILKLSVVRILPLAMVHTKKATLDGTSPSKYSSTEIIEIL